MRVPAGITAHGPALHADLLAAGDKHGVVRQESTATAPNQAWLWDFSEHPTREGQLYICAVKDVFSTERSAARSIRASSRAWRVGSFLPVLDGGDSLESRVDLVFEVLVDRLRCLESHGQLRNLTVNGVRLIAEDLGGCCKEGEVLGPTASAR